MRRRELRQLAGLAAWLAGLMPQLRPFTAMLWAALYSSKEETVMARQVKRPVSWLMAFADENFRAVEQAVPQATEVFHSNYVRRVTTGRRRNDTSRSR